jgi:hypothetical protein
MFENKFEKRMKEHPVFKNITNGTGGSGGGFCRGVRDALRGKIRVTGGAVVLLVGAATKKRPRGEAGQEATASARRAGAARSLCGSLGAGASSCPARWWPVVCVARS